MKRMLFMAASPARSALTGNTYHLLQNIFFIVNLIFMKSPAEDSSMKVDRTTSNKQQEGLFPDVQVRHFNGI